MSSMFISLSCLLGTTLVAADDVKVNPKANYMLINMNSGLALDVMNGSQTAGIQLVQSEPDRKNSSQHWKLEKPMWRTKSLTPIVS